MLNIASKESQYLRLILSGHVAHSPVPGPQNGVSTCPGSGTWSRVQMPHFQDNRRKMRGGAAGHTRRGNYDVKMSVYMAKYDLGLTPAEKY